MHDVAQATIQIEMNQTRDQMDEKLQTIAIECKGSPTAAMHREEWKSLTKAQKVRLGQFCRVERKLFPQGELPAAMQDQWEEDMERSIDAMQTDEALVDFELKRYVAHGWLTKEEAGLESE
jgi:hypothetical protein